MGHENLSDEDILRELYSDRGWSKERIAREYDCTKTDVSLALMEQGLILQWRDKEKMKEALGDGLTPPEMAEKWDVARSTIHEWLDRHGLKDRQELTEDRLRELYWGEEKSISEVAEATGRTEYEVSSALREFGIDTRSKQEGIRLRLEQEEAEEERQEPEAQEEATDEEEEQERVSDRVYASPLHFYVEEVIGLENE